jgi:hypothetical protein
MSRSTRIRRTILAVAPAAALAALALALPSAGQARVSWPDQPGYSDQFKPAGTGGGHRVR